MIMYKAVANVGGELRSIFDGSPYQIGVTRKEQAKDNHSGGLYCYNSIAAAAAAEVPRASKYLTAPRLIIACRIGGDIIQYGHKLAVSELTPDHIVADAEIAAAVERRRKAKAAAERKHRRTKVYRRAEWIKSHAAEIDAARNAIQCPDGCRAGCGNGATCRRSSGPAWGFWVQAFRAAGVKCEPMNYWSGSAPTPSTSINRGIADYVSNNAPIDIL